MIPAAPFNSATRFQSRSCRAARDRQGRFTVRLPRSSVMQRASRASVCVRPGFGLPRRIRERLRMKSSSRPAESRIAAERQVVFHATAEPRPSRHRPAVFWLPERAEAGAASASLSRARTRDSPWPRPLVGQASSLAGGCKLGLASGCPRRQGGSPSRGMARWSDRGGAHLRL